MNDTCCAALLFEAPNFLSFLSCAGAFWLSILGSIATFYKISPAAAALMVPTQIWVTIAAKLNYDIVHMNVNKNAKLNYDIVHLNVNKNAKQG